MSELYIDCGDQFYLAEPGDIVVQHNMAIDCFFVVCDGKYLWKTDLEFHELTVDPDTKHNSMHAHLWEGYWQEEADAVVAGEAYKAKHE